MSGPPDPSNASLPTEALGLSLSRILVRPLSALRASIEALAAELDRKAPQAAVLDGALEQVVRLRRDVETLVELAAPRPLAPLVCTSHEVALSALRGLSGPDRARVHYARPVRQAQLQVDGPLLSRCLTYLLQAALSDTPDWVLLRARRDQEGAVFSIVRLRQGWADLTGRIDPSQGPEEVARSVRVLAARRDLERMGAQLTAQPTERGLLCITVGVGAAAARTEAPREGER